MKTLSYNNSKALEQQLTETLTAVDSENSFVNNIATFEKALLLETFDLILIESLAKHTEIKATLAKIRTSDKNKYAAVILLIEEISSDIFDQAAFPVEEIICAPFKKDMLGYRIRKALEIKKKKNA